MKVCTHGHVDVDMKSTSPINEIFFTYAHLGSGEQALACSHHCKLWQPDAHPIQNVLCFFV